ncbi:fimbrial protein precursor [bacterium BMS3Abin11]|nr:fimbrial protein precursor [bacterium BMS3Abin11]
MKKVSIVSNKIENMSFPMKMKSDSKGFTLIEVMIVVALIGILAALAYPSFRDSIRKSRRGDAQQGLMEIAQKLENFYARNATYTTDLTQIGYTNVGWNNVTAGSSTVYYQVRVFPVTAGCALANCFLLETQSMGDQVNDPVSRFTLSSTGAKQLTKNGVTKNGWK